MQKWVSCYEANNVLYDFMDKKHLGNIDLEKLLVKGNISKGSAHTIAYGMFTRGIKHHIFERVLEIFEEYKDVELMVSRDEFRYVVDTLCRRYNVTYSMLRRETGIKIEFYYDKNRIRKSNYIYIDKYNEIIDALIEWEEKQYDGE